MRREEVIASGSAVSEEQLWVFSYDYVLPEGLPVPFLERVMFRTHINGETYEQVADIELPFFPRMPMEQKPVVLEAGETQIPLDSTIDNVVPPGDYDFVDREPYYFCTGGCQRAEVRDFFFTFRMKSACHVYSRRDKGRRMLMLLLLAAADPYKDARAYLGELIPMATVSADDKPVRAPHFEAMRTWLDKLCKKEGFALKTFGENDVFEVSVGDGPAKLAFVLHGDVVPAPRHEWSVDPFVLTEKDGKLFGRGTEDDKGPLAATLAVLAHHKRAGWKPNGRVLVIIGMGEEHGWEPMRAYVEQMKEKPEHVVSLDSGYPVTANEFGFVAWELTFGAGKQKGALAVKSVSGGEFLTQVPGAAKLVVEGKGAAAIVEKAVKGDKHFKVSADKDVVTIDVAGKAVHSSSATEGDNALWALGALAEKLPLAPSPETTALLALGKFFAGDHWGKKLGLAYEDKDMGKLLVVPTVLRGTLGVNMRRPKGKTSPEFKDMLEASRKSLEKALGASVTVTGETYVGEPHVAQMSTTVPVLLDIYAKAKNVKNPKAETIRGGTYARLFPGAVNFGPSLPDEPYMGHAPDEYITVHNLELTVAMLSEALTRLTK